MPIQHIFLAILVAAVWGCNFIFVKLGVHEIPPLFLCAIRFFLASIPAVFFIRLPTGTFKKIALYGLVMFGLQFSLIFTGMAVGMTAGMASLVVQTQIFFSILFAVIFMREAPTLWQILGALVSFAGIGLAVLHLDSHMTLLGFLLVMGGAVAWGLGNLITKQLGQINMLALVAWGSLVAFPPLLLVSFIIEGKEAILYSMQHFSGLAVICLVYIVYMSTWVGYGVWSWLISRYPISTVVPFTLLVPVFAMVGSVLFMQESFETWKMATAALVIAGLCINSLVPHLIANRKNRRMMST